MKKKDERDILFARCSYEKGTFMHEDYYGRNPDKLEFDEKMRRRPIMGDEQSGMYNKEISSIPFGVFDFLGDIKHLSEGKVNEKQSTQKPEVLTKIVKGLGMYYGAKDIRIVKLNEEHYYSHKGRPEKDYGVEIAPIYKYGIAFCVEMEEALIDTAPNVIQSIATSKGYVDAAVIGMVISYYIRELGFEARNNMDGNYLFPLVKVCQDAGIGEIGLNGLLVTKEYGPRVRLGLVSTNLPLIADEKERLYIRAFCNECKRCQKHCSAKAIKDKLEDFNDEICISMWQHLGSDCGMCMSACPFSHHLPHELIEDLSTKVARERLKKYCDAHYVGRSVSHEYPDWLTRNK